MRQGFEGVSGEGVDAFNGVYFGAKEFDADGVFFGIGGKYIEGVSADAKATGCGFVVVTFVLNFDQFLENLVAIDGFALFYEQDHFFIVFGGAESVDTRDGGNDDDVVAVEKGIGGGEAKALNFGVNGSIFFDKGVGLGDIGFGLIVVVVGDEVFDGIVREKSFELGIELCGKGFVVTQHESGATVAGDRVGHGEGFPGAGYAFEGLKFLMLLKTLIELFNGLWLIAHGFELSFDLKRCVHEVNVLK